MTTSENGDRREKVGFFRILLSLAFAAVLAVVVVTTEPLIWILGIPLVVIIFGLAFPYQRAIRRNGDVNSKTAWLGLVFAVPSVIAIMIRGTEVAFVAGPLLSIAGGILAWVVLRWAEAPSSSDRPKGQDGASVFG